MNDINYEHFRQPFHLRHPHSHGCHIVDADNRIIEYCKSKKDAKVRLTQINKTLALAQAH